MVWFQCEACGDELKKPKLPNHFRQCPSYKLSCIDCGQTFDKQTVQSHTQCITEAEKYGPKGDGKITNGTPAKEKPKLDVDINVGLSNRPPWFCSLCNTKATSQQALLLHADGKKHRAKVRAHTAKQKASEEAVLENKNSVEDSTNNKAPNTESAENKEKNNPPNRTSGVDDTSIENGNLSAKKRKLDTSSANGSTEKCPNKGNGDTLQADLPEKPKKLKKAKCEAKLKIEEHEETQNSKEKSKEKVKWKKLITSVLKSTSNGSLKMKKLRQLVFKQLEESGIAVDDTKFSTILEHKVKSSSKFTVNGKYVSLAI